MIGEKNGPWLDDGEQSAWRVYLSSHSQLLAELNRRLQDVSGLTLAEYEVLVRLSEAPNGRLRSFTLADDLQWERSRLAHQLSRMEKRGLVERTPCPEDRRGSHVGLTAAGRRSIRRAAPHHAADVRELFINPAGGDLAGVRRASVDIAAAIRVAE